MDKQLNELLARYEALAINTEQLITAKELLCSTYEQNGKVLIAGNGGSAADAEHIVGELMKGFMNERKLSEAQAQSLIDVNSELGKRLASALQTPLPAISLSGHNAFATAFANDSDAEFIFAQQVLGLGKEGDCLIALSTSGNSKNIIAACVVAKAQGMKILALTGGTGGELAKIADVAIIVSGNKPSEIQELHLPVYHYLCATVESYFFD